MNTASPSPPGARVTTWERPVLAGGGGGDGGGNAGVGAKHRPAMGTDHTEEGVFRDKFSGGERAQLALGGHVMNRACHECVWLLLLLGGKALLESPEHPMGAGRWGKWAPIC